MTREPRRSRQRIIDAASALLREVGYEGFSLRKLGGRLDLTASAIYAHFSGKEELLHSVLDQEFAQAAQSWFSSHPAPPEGGTRGRLRRLAHFYLTMGLGNPTSYRTRFPAGRGMDEQIRKWAAGSFREGDNAVHLRAAAAAWAGSDPASDPEGAGRVFLELWGVMHGLILAYTPLPMPTEEKVSAALAATTRYLEGTNA